MNGSSAGFYVLGRLGRGVLDRLIFGSSTSSLLLRRSPQLLACWDAQHFCQHFGDKTPNLCGQYEEIPPAYYRKKRNLRLALKERKKKLVLSQQSLRRKKDLFLNRLSDARVRITENVEQAKARITENVEHIIERENIWTVPNILCVGRIIVCPYLGYLILDSNYTTACFVLIFAGITDLLDGYIARNFKAQSSKLGSFLDPLADKILVATVFLTLTYVNVIPVLLTSIIVARDVSLAAAGFYIRYQSLPPPKTISRYFDPSHATAQLAPTMISKVNTFIQLGTIFCTLSAPVFGFVDHPYLTYLWCLTGATTIFSAGSYIFSSNTYKILKDAKNKNR